MGHVVQLLPASSRAVLVALVLASCGCTGPAARETWVVLPAFPEAAFLSGEVRVLSTTPEGLDPKDRLLAYDLEHGLLPGLERALDEYKRELLPAVAALESSSMASTRLARLRSRITAAIGAVTREPDTRPAELERLKALALRVETMGFGELYLEYWRLILLRRYCRLYADRGAALAVLERLPGDPDARRLRKLLQADFEDLEFYQFTIERRGGDLSLGSPVADFRKASFRIERDGKWKVLTPREAEAELGITVASDRTTFPSKILEQTFELWLGEDRVPSSFFRRTP